MNYDSPANALEAPWILSCWNHLEDQALWDVTSQDESLSFRKNCAEVFTLLNGVGYRARHLIMTQVNRPLGVSKSLPFTP